MAFHRSSVRHRTVNNADSFRVLYRDSKTRCGFYEIRKSIKWGPVFLNLFSTGFVWYNGNLYSAFQVCLSEEFEVQQVCIGFCKLRLYML